MRLGFGRYTPPGIADSNFTVVAVLFQENAYASVSRRIFDGVVKQVENHSPYEGLVTTKSDFCTGCLIGELKSFLGCERAHGPHAFVHALIEVKIVEHPRILSRIGAGERE